ncbi:hypothetical protein ACFRAU_14500 [Arthrobacter sp. NPDC056691]|uniref:hypothetical protein n=1 Tax=Arthrobacter sp. NPDC056691 TaxID=3345913 RepID=UPI003671D0C0
MPLLPTGRRAVSTHGHTVIPDDRLRDISIVQDGTNYIVGSSISGVYVDVPEIGALILTWLQSGSGVADCEARAATLMGQPVDVASFLRQLEDENVLVQPLARHRPEKAPRGARAGRLLFGAAGTWAQVGLGLTGAALIIGNPDLRPSPADFNVGGSPLVSLLTATVISCLCTVLHEAAHVLAAASEGVRSTLSISRRMYFVTAQTDLTRLWSLPRRQRYRPLIAGITIDAAITGLLLIICQAAGPRLGEMAISWIRMAVVLQLSALTAQSALFMRTDLYAVLATFSGSRTLWRTKTAVLHSWLGKPTTEDTEVLGQATPKELSWARRYLALYIPGLALAGWYLMEVTLPGVVQILHLAIDELGRPDFSSSTTWAAVASVVLVVLPSGTVLLVAGHEAVTKVNTFLRTPRSNQTRNG